MQKSRWLETAPVGGPPQGQYLNGVVEIETDLHPPELLKHLQSIEQKLGRASHQARWGPRTVDLDIVAYGNEIVESEQLTLPHPRMHERSFVLLPMQELAPHWKHPKLGKSIDELLNRCQVPNLKSAPGTNRRNKCTRHQNKGAP